MPHPDEGLIHAWLDGELSPDEAARVERLVNDDPEWAAAAGEARGLVAASSRILSALDVVPGGVLPTDSGVAPATGSAAGHGGRLARASRARSRFSVRPWMRVAAGLVIIVGTTVVVTNRVDVESAFEPGGVDVRATAEVQPQSSALADADRRRATDSSARIDEAREAVAAALSAPTTRSRTPSVSQPTADSSPARKSTSQSRAVAPTPATTPAPPRPDSIEALRAVTPPAESPPVDNVMRLRSERGFGAVSAQSRPVAAGMTVSATVLDGCWRTITRAPVDSVLVSPRILETAGRMLTIAAGELAVTVVQQADTLRGTIIDAAGARVPFRAERVVCRD